MGHSRRTARPGRRSSVWQVLCVCVRVCICVRVCAWLSVLCAATRLIKAKKKLHKKFRLQTRNFWPLCSPTFTLSTNTNTNTNILTAIAIYVCIYIHTYGCTEILHIYRLYILDFLHILTWISVEFAISFIYKTLTTHTVHTYIHTYTHIDTHTHIHSCYAWQVFGTWLTLFAIRNYHAQSESVKCITKAAG